MADQHKSFDPVLAKRIQYKCGSLEEIVEESVETFDVIVASEVVEHVADLEMFIKCCSQVLKVREFLLSLLEIFILFYYGGFRLKVCENASIYIPFSTWVHEG